MCRIPPPKYVFEGIYFLHCFFFFISGCFVPLCTSVRCDRMLRRILAWEKFLLSFYDVKRWVQLTWKRNPHSLASLFDLCFPLRSLQLPFIGCKRPRCGFCSELNGNNKRRQDRVNLTLCNNRLSNRYTSQITFHSLKVRVTGIPSDRRTQQETVKPQMCGLCTNNHRITPTGCRRTWYSCQSLREVQRPPENRDPKGSSCPVHHQLRSKFPFRLETVKKVATCSKTHKLCCSCPSFGRRIFTLFFRQWPANWTPFVCFSPFFLQQKSSDTRRKFIFPLHEFFLQGAKTCSLATFQASNPHFRMYPLGFAESVSLILLFSVHFIL